jgi:hypothetical protein
MSDNDVVILITDVYTDGMSTNHEPEVWTSPNGVSAELHFAGLTSFEPVDDDEYDGGWYADFPGQRHPADYVLSVVGQPFDVVEEITVHPTGGWGYYDAISDLLVRDGWAPPLVEDEECPHGLSLSLCADPINHYPLERAW